MMLIPTHLRPSKIDGLGVHATRFIPRGTKVWEYSEPCDRRIFALCNATTAFREFVEKYGYRENGRDYIELCGDSALFFNHSDDPNCGNGDNPDATYALRDIYEGEEMTQDYRTFNIIPMPFLDK